MSFYDFTVPAYLQMLGSLSASLTKAAAYAAARKIEPATLLGTRLFPDMLPLSRQVQLACDYATKGAARLSGSEVPVTPDTETSFDELQQRIAKTVDYLKGFKPAQFDDAAVRQITFPSGPAKTTTLTGQQFLSNFSLPNFYFHVSIAHGILRMSGIDVGKHDFLGAN
ncbi:MULTISPECIES: DUF1993 domain-containing protein [Rhodopseudomonas]|uniref:DUF1993 domain-containing protein n=1 Tax=Rhodopseudomonas palustris TaxID=1076 RepID=A0A0D7E3V3_RHOPL|nr:MULTISPECIES: DUF1993 domain-containing protein [Rhodopseudomonas]KIZ34262.1 hypothetical protein OO17_27065 [Rhodopseudomonas palustris]MDF3813002.1 DUF1993 domain-containing protein [Rhodopseudomonas sp. BAL398]WOK15593.1 DUF1993 domain-containing protein [Rhodopseudomonas sp. BAL398]